MVFFRTERKRQNLNNKMKIGQLITNSMSQAFLITAFQPKFNGRLMSKIRDTLFLYPPIKKAILKDI